MFHVLQKYEMLLQSNQSSISNIQPLHIQQQSEPVVVTIPAHSSVVYNHEPRAGEYIGDVPEQPVTFDVRMGMETENTENAVAIDNFASDLVDLGHCLQELQDESVFNLHGLGYDSSMCTDSSMLEALTDDDILQTYSSGDMVC